MPTLTTEPRSWISTTLDGRTARSAAGPGASFSGRSAADFGSVALTALLGSDGFLAAQAVAADGVTPVHEPARAQGPSACRRRPRASSSCSCTAARATSIPSTTSRTSTRSTARRSRSRRSAAAARRTRDGSSGPSGRSASTASAASGSRSLFPHLATCVDDIAFIHSMYAESPIHGSAMLMMNSGRLLSGNPCLGTWVNYGLGSENENLPGFVVMLDRTGGPISGSKNWSSGYMPAAFQATVLRSDGVPIHDLASPAGTDRATRRLLLDRLRAKNEDHLAARADNSELAARIASYELAFKMQQSAPEAVDFARESPDTLSLYGIDQPRTADFGRKCLIARRMVERGVRFVQIYSGGAHNDDNWDAHSDLVQNHTKHAGNTDKPIAGLLKDLKRRGLARRDPGGLGRRVRPPADRRKRQGHRARPQRVRLHDVDGRRRNQGRNQRRQDRRAGKQRHRGPLPRQEPACHDLAAARARPQRPLLLLRRAAPEAGGRRGGRADPADYLSPSKPNQVDNPNSMSNFL